ESFAEGGFVTFFEMPIYVPEGISAAQLEEFMDKYERWVQRLIEEFGARPHWGKNDAWVFDMHDPVEAYGSRFDSFRDAIVELDPEGVFSNAWSIDRGLREAP
ncbi:MAG: D-arabinono-1,4-lactone oxidase, partial [Myxococcota bacterium]